jgi:transmembrane sensor
LNKELENIDDLLGKYLAGEASETELTVVRKWIGESDENRVYFQQMKKIFDGAAAIKEWKNYDTDAAWNKVRSNLRTAPVRSMKTDHLRITGWWKIAASLLILISVGIYLVRSVNQEISPVELVAKKQVLNDTLPDGSSVFLNKETKVTYAYHKQTGTHDVKLKGEAYFNISNAKHEQFIVDAGNVFIKDIGTSFNVKAYPGSDLVEVLVEEGEIIFFTSDNPGIHLKESGKAVYNRKTKQFTIDQPDANITAYKTKFFVFSATDLGSAVASLNDVYDTTVVVPDHLKSCPITVSFRNESIEEITAIIAETLNLTVTRENGRIILNGKGCE